MKTKAYQHATPCTSLPSSVRHFDELPDSALVAVRTACTVSDRSRASLYRDFAAGRLTLIKIGSSARVRVGELRAMLGGAQ